MKLSVIVTLMVLALPATAPAQSAPSGGSASSSADKPKLSEIRAIVRTLEGNTDKLRELLTQHRSLVEQRPEPEGSSPEAKKAHQVQLDKWSAALDRLLTRIDAAHAAVADTSQRLDKAVTGELPTALAKDVAKARNEANAERATAEQILAKRKAAPARKPKPEKAKPEQPEPELPDDLDL